jgi:hypothetical protein
MWCVFSFVRTVVFVGKIIRQTSADKKSIRWTSCCGHRVLSWKRHRQDFHLTDNSRQDFYPSDKCGQEIHPLDKLLRTSCFIVKTTQTRFPSDRQFQTRFLFVRQIVSVRQTSRFCSSDEKSIRWTSCCGHRVLWWKRHRQDFHLTDNSRQDFYPPDTCGQ